MIKMLKLMKRQKLGLIVLLLLSDCLIGSLSCAGLKKFPVDTIIEHDTIHKTCGLYRIVDYEQLKYKYEKEIECPDTFGFSSKDIPKVLDWGQDAVIYSKQHCH